MQNFIQNRHGALGEYQIMFDARMPHSTIRLAADVHSGNDQDAVPETSERIAAVLDCLRDATGRLLLISCAMGRPSSAPSVRATGGIETRCFHLAEII